MVTPASRQPAAWDNFQAAPAPPPFRRHRPSHHFGATDTEVMGRLDEAESEARKGLSLVQPFPGTRTGVTATLAHVLAQREQFHEVLALLETSTCGNTKSTIEDDGTGSVAFATALLAMGRRQEGRSVVASACTTVAARAATIADRATREGYLLFAPRAAEIARLAGRLAILYPGIDDLGNGMT